MKSIIQADREHCFICGRNSHADYFGLEEHHVFEGHGRKAISERYGLKVYICGDRCHRNGKDSVHKNAKVNRAVKKVVQKRAMQYYGWTVEDFIEILGRNYI
jgi:hypothetical protein